jgi:hypothetical protein
MRVTTEGSGATEAAQLPRLKLRRLSEDAVLMSSADDTFPLYRKGVNAAGKGNESEVPRYSSTPLSSTRLHTRQCTARPEVRAPNTLHGAWEKNLVEVDDRGAVEESPWCSDIIGSPPAISLAPSRGDAPVQELCCDRYAAVEKEEVEWPPSPPLPTHLWVAPTLPATPCATAAATGAAQSTPQRSFVQASSRINLVPHRAPAAVIRPTRSFHSRSDSNSGNVQHTADQGSTFAVGNSTGSAAAQQSITATYVFATPSRGNHEEEDTAGPDLSPLELTELSASASPLPPFNLPTQPSSPQGALPHEPSPLLDLRGPSRVHPNPSLSFASSEVVMASATSSPSPSPAPPCRPPQPFSTAPKVCATTTTTTAAPRNSSAWQQTTDAAAAAPWEELPAFLSDFPGYQPLSPMHGRQKCRAAVPTHVSDAASFTLTSVPFCSPRTTPPHDTQPTPLPTTHRQFFPPPPMSVFDARHTYPSKQPDALAAAGAAVNTSTKAVSRVGYDGIEAGLQPFASTSPLATRGGSSWYHPPPPNNAAALPPSAPRKTLQDYVKQMDNSAGGARSFTGSFLVIGASFCFVPLCCSILLLGLHSWAVELQERSYLDARYRPHAGSMYRTDFTLLLGIALCAVVMGFCGGLVVYALLYRQAIRYQRRAFALCAKLPHRTAPVEAASEQPLSPVPRRTAATTGHTLHQHMSASAAVVETECEDDGAVGLSDSPVVFRWHREVFALLDALTSPLGSSMVAMEPFVSAPPRPHKFLLPQEQIDRPFFLRAAQPGAFAAHDGRGRVLPCTRGGEVGSISNNNGDGGVQHGASKRREVEAVVLSRRPRHPADESRLHDVVTVVVCCFLVPPPLVVGQRSILRAQLEELESLSLAFHTRLRRAAQGHEAFLTDCGISEVVFSINTVRPVQSLVANTTAVALALAVQKELLEWAPTYKGEQVQWGVAVHRFRAVLRSARGLSGRLTLSFGSLEYDAARELAQLAALCGYGVLCHADFFTDAMNEARGLPVDYVMDRTQRLFFVYKLHDEDVPEESKRNMADALRHMCGGRYDAACEFLKTWKDYLPEGELFPSAAWHLLYVAHFLLDAVVHNKRGGLSGTGPLTQSLTPPSGTNCIPGFPEWSAKMLALSYSRPPPVWEEDSNPSAAAPQWSNLSFLSAQDVVHSDNKNDSRQLLVAVPPATPDFLRRTSGGDAAADAGHRVLQPSLPHPRQGAAPPVGGDTSVGVLQRMVPGFFRDRYHLAPAAAAAAPPPVSVRSVFEPPPPNPRHLATAEEGAVPSWNATTTTTTTLRLSSPLTIDSPSTRMESGLLSPVGPQPATAAQHNALHVTAESPVILPQAVQEAERKGCQVRDVREKDRNGTPTLTPVAVTTAHTPASPTSNPLSPVVNAATPCDNVIDVNLLAPLLPESMRAHRGAAVSPSVQLLPHRTSILLSPGSADVGELNDFQNLLSVRSGGSRHVRRKNSSDSKSSRSRGRSGSFIFDDEPGENESAQNPGHTASGHVFYSLTSPVGQQHSTLSDGVNCFPTSAHSAQSLTLSGCTQHRTAPLTSKLPLFSDSAVTVPGVELGTDDSRNIINNNSDGDTADHAATNSAEISRERSMTSVMQRSRSMMSGRAAASFTPAAVVCTRTRCISRDHDHATQVFQGFHPHGYLVAIKRVSKQSTKVLQLQRNEIHLLRGLSHSNIVHFIGDWEDDVALYMAMEYACETLASVLGKFGRLLPGVVRHYVRGILRALAYLHESKNIVHRDVSPNNIIITNASDSSDAKLIDFGRSMQLPVSSLSSAANPTTVVSVHAPGFSPPDNRSVRSSDSLSSAPPPPIYASVVGTPLFMSPQACQGLVHPANDVWSVGVIMYLCLTGEYPYPADTFVDPDVFIADVGSSQLTPTLGALGDAPSKERAFIEQCLRLDYTERPSAATLLSHPFIIV